MAFTVHIVLALTGCEFLLEVRQQRTPPLSSSSPVGLSSQSSFTSFFKVFLSDVVSCIHSHGSTAQRVSGSLYTSEGGRSRQSYVELFDYATLNPLSANEVISEGHKLLLFTTPMLTNTLAERQRHHLVRDAPPNANNDPAAEMDTSAMDAAHASSSVCACTEESRWQNLRQALLALQVPLRQHRELMEQELQACTQRLDATLEEFHAAKDGINDTLAELGKTDLFYTPETRVLDLIDVHTLRFAVQQGESKLRDASHCLEKAQSSLPDVLCGLRAEAEVFAALQSTPAWRCGGVVPLMREASRAVEAVRRLLLSMGLVTKHVRRGRHYCDAVLQHVVQRHEKLRRLPAAMRAAREVLQRRVILRRAVRRLVAPLETEHRATEAAVDAFAAEWAHCLPEKVFRAVTSPLPPLYPSDDAVAQGFDRHLVDLEEDKTEALLVSIAAGSPGTGAARELQGAEERLRNAEKELGECRMFLKLVVEKNVRLEETLKKLTEDGGSREGGETDTERQDDVTKE